MLRKLIFSAIKMRLYTINARIAKGTSHECIVYTQEFKRWLEFNKKAGDDIIADYVRRHIDKFKLICPENKGGKSIFNQVTQLIKQ